MSIISTQPASSQAFAGNSCTFRLAATLKRWSAVYLNWRLRQAAIAELAVLSDRELKDMGLTRGEIEGSVTNASKMRARVQSLKLNKRIALYPSPCQERAQP